jgi:DNA-binding NtrC family response regulator
LRNFEQTTPLVAQARVTSSKTMDVLLHLHIPEIRGQEKLENIFSDTLAMKVVVTSSYAAVNLHSDNLAHFSYEFLPRASVPVNTDNNAEPAEPHANLVSIVEGKSLKEIEKSVIEAVISSMGGSVPKAAKKLDVSPSTLYRKREAWAAEQSDELFLGQSFLKPPTGIKKNSVDDI